MIRLESFRHALRGLGSLLLTQPNARVHFLAAAFVVGAGFAFDLGMREWCWITVAITMVVVAEALNTAVEILGDAVSDGRRHPLVGRAKDVAAGAVLLAAMGAAVIGVIIFLPHVVDVMVGVGSR